MKDIPDKVHISYQFQYRKCSTCKACKDGGSGHGPYFYAYWKLQGKPKSQSTGKVLKVEIVQAYFRQVYRLSPEETPERWQAFKTKILGDSVSDESLPQKDLRDLALKIKEQCQRSKKGTSSAPPAALEPQQEVA